jgi:hypothetical protein
MEKTNGKIAAAKVNVINNDLKYLDSLILSF